MPSLNQEKGGNDHRRDLRRDRGVDTHLDVHVAAALDGVGGLLGVESFPTNPPGYTALTSWLCGFGTVQQVGVEGTGSYGAGLARHLAATGITVVEVDRADRASRRQSGKSDPLDAISAARAALSGRARGQSKGRDGQVEAIRTLMVAKGSARRDRTAAINRMRALILTAPDPIRVRFAHHTTISLVKQAGEATAKNGPCCDNPANRKAWRPSTSSLSMTVTGPSRLPLRAGSARP